jgi:hypothetical protein
MFAHHFVRYGTPQLPTIDEEAAGPIEKRKTKRVSMGMTRRGIPLSFRLELDAGLR